MTASTTSYQQQSSKQSTSRAAWPTPSADSSAQERLDELRKLDSASANAPLGWLSSTTGRVRCFIILPHEFPVGNLLAFLEAIEKIYFKKHPEDEAEGFSINF